MWRYLVKRLLLFFPTVLLVTLFVFLFLRIIPGDPALVMLEGLGEGGYGAVYTEETLQALKKKLGTDKPVHVQYGVWIWDMARGDMGRTIRADRPVIDDLKNRAPVTLELAIISILMSFIIGVPLGVVMALTQDTWVDYITRVISLVGIAVPVFVAGLLTIYVLSNVFNWIPFGYKDIWEDPVGNVTHMILPAVALGIHVIAFIARMTRSAVLEVLREDYIRTARAKGVHERRVIFLHALQNAFLPILTISGWAFALMLSGSVIIESIFLLPGLGTLVLTGISHRDYPTVQGVVILTSLLVLTVNLFTDLLYAWLDPRIRYT